MALFGSKKKIVKTKAKAETKAVAVVSDKVSMNDLAHIIKRPRITEKASMKSESGVYVFDVSPDATKYTISQAVMELYKVNPIKVGITQTPAKKVFVRGKWGIAKGGKKAYVYLKKGETIEFV